MTAAVTVVVPVYNGEEYLAEALDSVLAQEPQPAEVIVVDDGSTDGSFEVASRFPVRCVRQENAGPAIARNVGIELAGSELVGFIDADDLWPAGKLALHLAEFAAAPSLDAVLGRYQLWALEEAGGFRRVGEPALSVNLGAGVYRRELFARLGPLRPEAVPSEDVDWYLRMRESGAAIKTIDDVTLEYRIHTTNITSDRDNSNTMFLKALAGSIRRRRKAEEA